MSKQLSEEELSERIVCATCGDEIIDIEDEDGRVFWTHSFNTGKHGHPAAFTPADEKEETESE